MAGMGRGALRIAIEDFLNTFRFDKILARWIKTILEGWEDELLIIYKKLLDSSGMAKYLPPEFQMPYVTGLVKSSQTGILILVLKICGFLVGGFSGLGQPVGRMLSYTVEPYLKTWRPDPTLTSSLFLRDPENAVNYYKSLEQLGVEPFLAEALRKMAQQVLPPLELEALRLRGQIDGIAYWRDMSWLGLTPERVTQVQNLAQQIPGAQDLIRMAVREAWNDEIVSRFQYDSGFPQEFKEWMEKQGYSEEWSKRYWRQHWELPGLNAGYEMLHRLREGVTGNTFSEDDLETLLKTADIPEFFRKRLIEISFSPYTRVDVRRMYGAGVISKDEVYNAYRDLGYNDDHARNLTEFTVTLEKAEEKGLTKDAITGGYKRGIISRTEAVSMLSELRYSANEADFWLGLVDYDLAAQETNEKLKSIQAQYVNHIIDEPELSAQLGPLNLPAERQASLQTLWNIQRNAKVDLPSRSDLESFYKLTLINEDQFISFMKQLGFRADVIPWYVQRLNLSLAEDTKKEAERAAKEADRLARLKTATALQRTKAVLDANIAEARVTIADLRVALYNVTDPDEKKSLQQAIVNMQKIITGIELEKAMASIPPD